MSETLKITMTKDGVINVPKPDGNGVVQIKLTPEQLQAFNAGQAGWLSEIDIETQVQHVPV